MTKSAEGGFEFGNHHRCDRKGSMDGPAVVLHGMKGLDKGRIWWGANLFYSFSFSFILFRFLFFS
jgi:hypothetical protein